MMRKGAGGVERLRGQTQGEQTACRNALALFFGALLGAALGEPEGVDIQTCVAVISVLAAAVMVEMTPVLPQDPADWTRRSG